MNTLTLQYQYPDETQRLLRAKSRAFTRHILADPDVAEQVEGWSDHGQVLAQVVFDSSADNAVFGKLTAHPQYEEESALNVWETVFSQTSGGGTELVFKASLHTHQVLCPAYHYIPSSLVNEAEECTKFVEAFRASRTPAKFTSADIRTRLLQLMRGAIADGKAPVREEALRAITDRVAQLRLSAAEEEINVNESSQRDLEKFVRQLPFTAPPLVFLLDEGTFRLVWRGDREQVALEFLGNETIRYVFFAARPEPVSEAKSAGIDDAMHIVEQIKTLGLAHLIGHVR